MEKLNVWSESIKRKVEEQDSKIFRRDYKFFKIDRLINIAERTDSFSDDCSVCTSNKKEIEDIVEKLSDYINGTIRERAEYEKRNEKIVKHMKFEHGLVQKGYFSALYSFAGLGFGTILGFGISYLINPAFFKFGLLAGFTVGVITGRILGNRVDKKKKSLDLILS